MRKVNAMAMLLAGAILAACAGAPVREPAKVAAPVPPHRPAPVPPAAVSAPSPARETPEALPDPAEAWTRGLRALKEKDFDEAARLLAICADAPQLAVDCRWELGWANFMLRRFREARANWTRVQELAPTRPDLEEVLKKADEYLAIVEAMEKAKAAARVSALTVPDGRYLRILAVGDVMMGTDYPYPMLPTGSAGGPLGRVAELLKDGDVIFANLEGPLCDGGSTQKCRPGQKCFAFRTPSEYVRHLKEAGVNLVSLANNHSHDFGEFCRAQTEQHLSRSGVRWSGAPGTWTFYRKRNLIIGMVAFHSSEITNNSLRLDQAALLVGEVANDVDVMIVSFHGGAEGFEALHVPKKPEVFYGESRGDVMQFARRMIDVGADVVLGHGPHVPRAMEIYKRRLIAYSLGNFATYGAFNLTGFNGTGLVLALDVDRKGRFVRGRIRSTRQTGRGIPEPDPEGTAADLIRWLSAHDFPETGVRVGPDGALYRPLETGVIRRENAAPGDAARASAP